MGKHDRQLRWYWLLSIWIACSTARTSTPQWSHHDYQQQARLKLLGSIDVLDGERMVLGLQRITRPDCRTVAEGIFLIQMEAYDWNVPQLLVPRYAAKEMQAAVVDVEDKLRSMEMKDSELCQKMKDLRSGPH
jgi:hypothetical protein